MSRSGTIAGASWQMPAERLALLIELLPTAQSFRDICGILGMRLDVVRRESAPFLAIMKLNGTHPKCGCGKDRFHPYGCADSYRKGWPSDCLPGHTRAESVVLLQKRQLVIADLVKGLRYCDIDRQFGMSKGGAKAYLRFLTSDQLAERERNRIQDRGSALLRRAA